MIIAFMLKWIWKLYKGEEGLWADLIRAKSWRQRLVLPRGSNERVSDLERHPEDEMAF
jgi:hypothetical protein